MAGDGQIDGVFSRNLDYLADKELYEAIIRFLEVAKENLILMREEMSKKERSN